MGTIGENRDTWSRHNWSRQGDEWSNPWGSTASAWYAMLLPRIHNWLPCGTILEIAPGFGRWTQFLKDYSRHLIGVDLVQECIAACRQRFSSTENVEFFVNDGRSLAMIPDNTVDFVFSFDSLVHVEADVMQAYISQLAQKLSADGVAFIHHSNVAALPKITVAFDWLAAQHWRLQRWSPIKGWRSTSVSGALVEQWCRDSRLQCRSQELVNWATRSLTDCFSVITRPTSKWARPNIVLSNPKFRPRQSAEIAARERLYGQ